MVNSYIALDIETTGLSVKEDRIIEIGAAKIIDGQLKESYITLVDPKMVLPERIIELTGIRNEDLAGEKSCVQAVSELIDFCEDYVLLGHNIIFDYSFIKACATNNKMKFEKQGIDTLKISRAVLPELENRSLSYLKEYFKIEQEYSHRAYYDAIAASMLYKKLADRFYDGNEDLFKPKTLIFTPKKQSPITPKQIKFLNDLLIKNNIKIDKEIESLTKNEASRIIDKILSGQFI